MFLIKKILLAVIAAGVIGGSASAVEKIDSSWASVGSNAKTGATSTTAAVGRVHSVAVLKGSIQWKVDVRIQGAKGRECVVAVELCNAAGQPYLRRDGSPVQLEESVEPDTDSYHVMDMGFQLGAERFWELYGRGAKDLTFRVVVKDEKTGKTLNQTAVMNLAGLAAKLPVAPPEKTDLPGINPGRYGNVWMRLIFA
jgi:hypothetical protein